jgi:hypothetical protein
MRLRRRWLLPTMLVGAALAWRQYRRGDLDRLVENLHRYSAPTATLYDAVTAPLLRRFLSPDPPMVDWGRPFAEVNRCPLTCENGVADTSISSGSGGHLFDAIVQP